MAFPIPGELRMNMNQMNEGQKPNRRQRRIMTACKRKNEKINGHKLIPQNGSKNRSFPSDVTIAFSGE